MKSNAVGILVAAMMVVCQLGCCGIGLDGECGCGSCGSSCGHPLFNGHFRNKIAYHAGASTCSAGCGEVYYDEQINEPPICDPCGCDGEFTDWSCGRCRPWFSRLRDMWGYRYYPTDCDSCGGCGHTTTGSNCSSCNGGAYESGETIYESAPSTHMSPAMQGTPTPARPAPKQEVAPMPVPDSNARMQPRPSKTQGLVVGTGAPKSNVSPKNDEVIFEEAPKQMVVRKSVQAKPASSRTRLVTNPK